MAFLGDRQAFLDFVLKVLLYQPPALPRMVPPQAPGRPQRAPGPSLDWLMNEPPDVAEVPSLFHWKVVIHCELFVLYLRVMTGTCLLYFNISC